ncbi:hypothetical protein [Jidongwangia harbinensis]|uniref:hypothetical protein n=1 Tax=Jidongwangia harbinensis TaxID=2878561 RepID=UPI001CD99970|nr:hypothetical protein [Jidongwangia harbinensis]MCA2211588.1 hypothetical protein [Jidongwangia harbinensis]
MLCSLIVLACLIAAVVLAARPQLRRAVLEAAGRPAMAVAPPAAVPEPDPQTLEGVLSRQLMTGEITGLQYRNAMASIASRDAARHPLDVPSQTDPPEPA